MELEKRAFYTLLRTNAIDDPSIGVEPWQVEEYRRWPLERLFTSLGHLGIAIDRTSFHHYADECDTPEALLELLSDEESDHVYLLLFEIWRRLEPEKPSLSIFGEELDHWIDLYDQDRIESPEKLQDLLDNLQDLLDENVDEGGDPLEVFEQLSRYCASDLESFLYDYIDEQLSAGEWDYSAELLDGFHDYVSDSLWFDLLYVRLWSHVDEESVDEALAEVIDLIQEESDLDLHLELLNVLARLGRADDFAEVVEETIDLLEGQDDFRELIEICLDLYEEIDRDPAALEEVKSPESLFATLSSSL